MHRLGRQRIGQEIALPRRGPGRSGQGRPATLLAGCLLGCASIAVPAQGLAQGLAVPGDQLRPGETRPALPEFLPPERPGGGVELPPVPAGPEAPLPPIERGPTFRLGGVRFVGNTVFGDEELAAELADLIGRPVTLDDLEEARIRLTLHYVNRGYINSGAVLPPQQVTDGIVTFEIVEGALTWIDIRGQEGLNPDYIRRRLELSAGPPLNIHDLEERFRLLRQDPLIDPIEGLNGVLGPGMHPGEAVLDLKVKRARPYALTLSFDNQRPPSIGAETGRITGTVRNLTGWGDMVSAYYARSAGATDIILDAGIPVTARDTTVRVRGRTGNDQLIEDPLSVLDISSRFWEAEAGIRHPLYRTPEQELALDLTLARRHSETKLLGEPFSFSPAARDGETDVTVLRVAQDWTDRSVDQVIAARSTLNFGLNILGAGRGEGGVDSRFVAWLGQIQWARRLTETGLQIILRADVQLSNDALPPLEQFPVGGFNSVRGYRENEFVADNGADAAIEARIPLFNLTPPGAPGFGGQLALAPFFDWGASWTHDRSFGQREDIYSIGVGLRWSPVPWLEAAVYYGYPLRDLPRSGNDLQDKGIYFSVVARPF